MRPVFPQQQTSLGSVGTSVLVPKAVLMAVREGPPVRAESRRP